MNFNKVTLVGRVPRDPELKQTASGKVVCSIGLATNREWKDPQGFKVSKTEWHNLVFWGKLAEIVGQYVTKGQEILVSGRIEYREYESKDGHKVKVTDIVVEDMQMGSKAGGGAPVQPQSESDNVSQPAPQEEIETIQIDDDGETVNVETDFQERQREIKTGESDEEEVKVEDIPF
jgi:single-strand DNA-binding protein